MPRRRAGPFWKSALRRSKAVNAIHTGLGYGAMVGRGGLHRWLRRRIGDRCAELNLVQPVQFIEAYTDDIRIESARRLDKTAVCLAPCASLKVA
jgi:hypothetical protein